MKLRFQIERAGFAIATSLARILPRDFFINCGKAFGRLSYKLDQRHRSVAIENFQLAFPDASNAKESILRCYEFFGAYLFEMLTCFPRMSSDQLQKYEIEGLDYLKQAVAKGKGVILFGAHYGAWELHALAQAMHGFPLGLLVRRLDNPYLEKLLENLRCSTGNFTIDKKQGFRPMLKALREGKSLAFLMDQNVITEDRIFVKFFGRPASTTPAVGLLKLKTDCELVPVGGYALPGNRHHFIYGPPVEIRFTGDRQSDVLAITQECTRRLEELIQDHPECWLWMHRRWKTQPAPEVTKV